MGGLRSGIQPSIIHLWLIMIILTNPQLGGLEVPMENEMPPANRVDLIREKLEELQGQRLRVRANMGRSRIVERAGVLVGAHPSLFIVEVE